MSTSRHYRHILSRVIDCHILWLKGGGEVVVSLLVDAIHVLLLT